jgi:hypothetical protein
VAKQFTGIEGSTVPLADTIEAFTKIDDYDGETTTERRGRRSRRTCEQAFFMCTHPFGGLDGRRAPGLGPEIWAEERIHHDGTVGTAVIDNGFLSVNKDVVTIVAEDVDASKLGA